MRSSRRLMRTVFYLLIMCIFAGCGGAEKASPKTPALVIGSDDYKPFNYFDEADSPSGIDVDLAKEACRRMGYRAVFKQINWDNKDDYLKSGEVDCLWGSFSMNGREDKYLWTKPYMNSRHVVAVTPGSDIYKLSDLEGRRIAVQAGTKPESIFLERTDPRIPEVKNVYCLLELDELTSAMSKGYADACAGHEEALEAAFKTADIPYRFLDEPLLESKLGVAFYKEGDRALCEKLSKTLYEMRSDGTIEKIIKSYGLDPKFALGEGGE